MAEYIEREAAKKAMADSYLIPKYAENNRPVTDKIIDSIPAADVAPVVHGRWTHLGGDEWCCSACGFVITTEGSWDKPTKKYCEDCGARMDGGADNGKMD